MNTKLIIIALFSLTAFTACQLTDANEENVSTVIIDPENPPVIVFEKTTHEFGEIVQGEQVKYNFRFTNDGKSPLVLASVEPGCGCTATEWPREPIAPGESGKIMVTFDSEGRSGDQKKVITVKANTDPSTTVIYLKGYVTAPNQ